MKSGGLRRQVQVVILMRSLGAMLLYLVSSCLSWLVKVATVCMISLITLVRRMVLMALEVQGTTMEEVVYQGYLQEMGLFCLQIKTGL